MKHPRWSKISMIGTSIALAAAGVGVACSPVVSASGKARATVAQGVPAYEPTAARAFPGSDSVTSLRVLGIPVVPMDRFPRDARAAIFGLPCIADPQFTPQLRRYLAGGGRALITERLAQRLGRLPSQFADRVYVLRTANRRQSLAALPQDVVDGARNFLLHPLGLRNLAPPRVLFQLVGGDRIRVENWNPWAAGVKITFRSDRWPHVASLESEGEEVPLQLNLATFQVPPRSSRVFRLARR
jgi:hypothetical protein